MDAFLNHWFSDYPQAREWLERNGGYLFPHRSQCFVAAAEAVRELGLDPDDPDWSLIGFDWVEPEDRDAWNRLVEKRLVASG